MQIFLDESGGTDPANTTFLVAAVAIAPADAARLIKEFRKAVGWMGEVKGHELALSGRQLFFDLLARQPNASMAVIACRRSEPLGGWAMRTLAEVDLYCRLLVEACAVIPVLGSAQSLTVTPDRGRYKKALLEVVRTRVTAATGARHPGVRVGVAFEDSARLPGLQIADVIANTALQATGTSGTAPTSAETLRPLVEKGRLVVRSVSLLDIRPAWLSDA